MIAAWSFIIAPFQGLEIILRCSPSPLGWAIESRTFGAYLIESRTFGAYLSVLTLLNRAPSVLTLLNRAPSVLTLLIQASIGLQSPEPRIAKNLRNRSIILGER
jgi:hypothetical protein